MQKRILNHIELVFENVDVGKIPAACIRSLHLAGIDQTICFSDSTGYFIENRSTESIKLMLKPEASALFKEPAYAGEEPMTIFDRLLRYSDLAYVELYFEDSNEPDRYPVPWQDASIGGEENLLQEHTITESGEFILTATSN